jgi:hypothetical protein
MSSLVSKLGWGRQWAGLLHAPLHFPCPNAPLASFLKRATKQTCQGRGATGRACEQIDRTNAARPPKAIALRGATTFTPRQICQENAQRSGGSPKAPTSCAPRRRASWGRGTGSTVGSWRPRSASAGRTGSGPRAPAAGKPAPVAGVVAVWRRRFVAGCTVVQEGWKRQPRTAVDGAEERGETAPWASAQRPYDTWLALRRRERLAVTRGSDDWTGSSASSSRRKPPPAARNGQTAARPIPAISCIIVGDRAVMQGLARRYHSRAARELPDLCEDGSSRFLHAFIEKCIIPRYFFTGKAAQRSKRTRSAPRPRSVSPPAPQLPAQHVRVQTLLKP